VWCGILDGKSTGEKLRGEVDKSRLFKLVRNLLVGDIDIIFDLANYFDFFSNCVRGIG